MGSGKYRTLLIAIARNEGPYLVEWVAYNLALGFDNILLYSNDNTDGSSELLDALHECGAIVHVDNSGVEEIPALNGHPSVQHRAYWKAAHHPLFRMHDWCSYIDIDEYIVFKKHRDLSDFLSDYRDNAAVAINWRIFGSSGKVDYSDAPVIERFTRCSQIQHPLNALVKCFFRPDQILIKALNMGPHYVRLKPGAGPYTYADRRGFLDYRDESCIQMDIVQINHYAIKSKSEYALKKLRGSSIGAVNTPEVTKFYTDAYFLQYDANDEEDSGIDYFLPRFRRMLYSLRANPKIAEIELSIKRNCFPQSQSF